MCIVGGRRELLDPGAVDLLTAARSLLAAWPRSTLEPSALATYEAERLRYGFDVVRAATAMGTRLMGQHPLPTT